MMPNWQFLRKVVITIEPCVETIVITTRSSKRQLTIAITNQSTLFAAITVFPSKDFIADCQRQEVYLQWVTTNDVVAIAEDQKTNNNLRRAQEKEALNKAVVAHAKATNTGIDGVKEMFEIAMIIYLL